MLPVLWTGRRLRTVIVLALAGALQAIAAIALSTACADLLTGHQSLGDIPALSIVAATALAAFVLTVAQFRYAEVFALSYVHDLRLAYARHVMLLPADGRQPAIGYIMTRIVNDMSAVKLWLSRGLINLIRLVPLIGTLIVWTVVNRPDYVLPIAATLGVWGLAVGTLIWPLRRAIRLSRKRRGAIASHAGRVFENRLPYLIHGRLGAILGRMEARSTRLHQALVARISWSGLMRAVSLATFPLIVVIYAMTADDPTADIAVFLMITAFLASQLDLAAAGLEYREAAAVALEKVQAVLRRSRLNDSIDPQRRPPDAADVVITGLSLSEDTSVSCVIPQGRGAALHGLAREEARRLALTLQGLTGQTRQDAVAIGDTPLSAIGAKALFRYVTLVSGDNPLVDEGKDATLHLFGARLRDEALEEALEGLLPDDHGQCSERERRLLLRLARAVARRPRIVVIHDEAFDESPHIATAFIARLRALGITPVILSSGPMTFADIEDIDLRAA